MKTRTLMVLLAAVFLSGSICLSAIGSRRSASRQ